MRYCSYHLLMLRVPPGIFAWVFCLLNLVVLFHWRSTVFGCGGKGLDCRLVVEHELAKFIRGLMQFIYPAASISAEYEITA